MSLLSSFDHVMHLYVQFARGFCFVFSFVSLGCVISNAAIVNLSMQKEEGENHTLDVYAHVKPASSSCPFPTECVDFASKGIISPILYNRPSDSRCWQGGNAKAGMERCLVCDCRPYYMPRTGRFVSAVCQERFSARCI